MIPRESVCFDCPCAAGFFGSEQHVPGIGHPAPFADAHLINERYWQYARRPYWRLKRILDLMASLAILALCAPILLLVGFLVALDGGMPVIFRQRRLGANGSPFRVWKFRTMQTAVDGGGRQRPHCERITAFGRFLRSTRIDELPQLVNVAAGQMSLIGPRPLLPGDQCLRLAARLAIRPGITGWAQVNGGREISPADKAALDVWYLANASLALDARIALATFALVLRGEVVNEPAIAAAWHSIRACGQRTPTASAAHPPTFDKHHSEMKMAG